MCSWSTPVGQNGFGQHGIGQNTPHLYYDKMFKIKVFQAQFFFNLPTLTTTIQLVIAKEAEIPISIQANDASL